MVQDAFFTPFGSYSFYRIFLTVPLDAVEVKSSI